jgi:hypothetical protein
MVSSILIGALVWAAALTNSPRQKMISLIMGNHPGSHLETLI